MAWRAWRSASAVTAQVLTMTVSVPAGGEAAHDLAFIGVQAAAEGQDVRRSWQTRSRRVKAVAAGPVISTWLSSRHSIVQAAAVDDDLARRWVRPRRCALTSVAQAPEPQARVRPAPRSQTRRRIVSGSMIWAKPILARCGKHRVVLQHRAEFGDRHGVPGRGRRTWRADCPCWRRRARPRQIEPQRVHRAG